MKSASSKRWINRQNNDFYVKEAKRLNYKSRAAFKLLEINSKHRILENKKNIVDLGCAPGGWIQVLSQKCKNANILGVDLLEIDRNEAQIIGDFNDENIRKEIIERMANVDLVLSDIAPSITGNKDIDRGNFSEIVHNIIDFAKDIISPNGDLLFKYFMFDEAELKRILLDFFKSVKVIKPLSSRSESSEIYILAQKKIKNRLIL